MKTIVGVSDVHVSNNPDDIIITYALGSCLGIAVHDANAGVAGLLHVMLPLSKSDPEKAKAKPAMYVDTGLAELLKACYAKGASKINLVISVAGGASMKQNETEDYFKIGKRNFTTLRKLLWKNGFMIARQDVGGNRSRTMAIRVSDGLVTINKQPMTAACDTGQAAGCSI
ncbi:MAG: chemotaxis protein CheD [Balneolaceae bacterium]